MKILLVIIFLVSGCVTTTTNTESDVSRRQLILLPEFMAMSMSEGYRQEIANAEKNNKLNNDKDELEKVRRIA